MIGGWDLGAFALLCIAFGYLTRGRVDEVRAGLRDRAAAKLRAAYEAEQAKRIDPHAHPMYTCGKVDLHALHRSGKRLAASAPKLGTLRTPAKVVHISVHARPEPTRLPGPGRNQKK